MQRRRLGSAKAIEAHCEPEMHSLALLDELRNLWVRGDDDCS
jgi:hypothetical protein